MTVAVEPEVTPKADEPLDRVEHLVCGDCFPDYVPGRQVYALCGHPVPDSDECYCRGHCGLRCLNRDSCPLCVLEVKVGGGCKTHGW